MPGWPFTLLFELIWLLFIVPLAVVLPKALKAIVTPCVFARGWATVPLLEMSKCEVPTPSIAALMACVAMFVPAGPAIRFPVMLSGVPTVPSVQPGALAEFPLPACTMMPPPEGKLVIVLLLIVGLFRLPAAAAVPLTPIRIALPSELAPEVLLVSVLLLMVRVVIVPPNSWMSTPW